MWSTTSAATTWSSWVHTLCSGYRFPSARSPHSGCSRRNPLRYLCHRASYPRKCAGVLSRSAARAAGVRPCSSHPSRPHVLHGDFGLCGMNKNGRPPWGWSPCCTHWGGGPMRTRDRSNKKPEASRLSGHFGRNRPTTEIECILAESASQAAARVRRRFSSCTPRHFAVHAATASSSSWCPLITHALNVSWFTPTLPVRFASRLRLCPS